MRGKERVAKKGGLFWDLKKLCNQIRVVFFGFFFSLGIWEVGEERRRERERFYRSFKVVEQNKTKPFQT